MALLIFFCVEREGQTEGEVGWTAGMGLEGQRGEGGVEQGGQEHEGGNKTTDSGRRVGRESSTRVGG